MCFLIGWWVILQALLSSNDSKNPPGILSECQIVWITSGPCRYIVPYPDPNYLLTGQMLINTKTDQVGSCSQSVAMGSRNFEMTGRHGITKISFSLKAT